MSNSKQANILKFTTHSYKVTSIAKRYGWLPGARYTNLRDIKRFREVGFLDIDWKCYNYAKHLEAVKMTKPLMTVAQDIVDITKLDLILGQAKELSRFCKYVVVVPKDTRLGLEMDEIIPKKYILGYSVPTKYGGTQIPTYVFKHPVHLLGGRPDVQRKLAEHMNVISFDCNRFTLDASFGDYFDGEIFRPHPKGGYDNCIKDSIKNINVLWKDYKPMKRSSKNDSRR